MLRLLAIAALCLGLLPSCVVIEREAEIETPSGQPPEGLDEEVPQASPEPLESSSDRTLVGSLGWALLSEDVPRAVLEIDQLGDAAISAAAVDALEQALREHGRKQEVEVVMDRAPVDQEQFSLEDLVSTAEEHRHRSSGDDTVAVHVLVLPGQFEVAGVPGVSFHATTIALFPEQVSERLPAGAQVDAFEAAIAVHELGHAFGLVNRTGAGADREDPEHPGHTDDEESVMYWAVESPSVTEVFATGPPSEFSDEDLEEMERIRQQRP